MALGVNYRTVVRCQQSRRVSRRMRQVLREFRDAQDGADDGPGIVAGDGAGDDVGETSQRWAAALKRENQKLRETVASQAEGLEALRRRVAVLDDQVQSPGGDDAIEVGKGNLRDCRPPRRGHGLPSTGVVTVEEQPDEEYAFGPAAVLEAEWREIRARMGERSTGSRVDRAVVAVRRWELESEMLGELHLTLPPEAEALDDSRRRDHVRWRGRRWRKRSESWARQSGRGCSGE